MARPKLGDGETLRLQLKISEEELEAIDDWRFSNRVASRSEAVRRLCQLGAALDPWVRAFPEIYLSVSAAEGAISEAIQAHDGSSAGNSEPLLKASAQLADARFELMAHVEGMSRVHDALATGKTLEGGIDAAKEIATSTADTKAAFGGIASLSHVIGTKKGGGK